LYDKREQVGLHPDVLDTGDELALRFRIRQATVEAAQKHDAEQAVARAVSARSRPMTVFEPGQLVFFYRYHPDKQRERAEKGNFLGPGSIIGLHGSGSVWIQFGGRCYLVAREHCRSLSPEEEALDETPLKNQMERLRRLMTRAPEEYEDLVGQPASAADLDEAASRPAVGEDEEDPAAAPGEAFALLDLDLRNCFPSFEWPAIEEARLICVSPLLTSRAESRGLAEGLTRELPAPLRDLLFATWDMSVHSALAAWSRELPPHPVALEEQLLQEGFGSWNRRGHQQVCGGARLV
jgi:hypothetical protein